VKNSRRQHGAVFKTRSAFHDMSFPSHVNLGFLVPFVGVVAHDEGVIECGGIPGERRFILEERGFEMFDCEWLDLPTFGFEADAIQTDQALDGRELEHGGLGTPLLGSHVEWVGVGFNGPVRPME